MSKWNEQSKSAWNESWSNGNGMSSALGIANGLIGITNAVKSNAEVEDTTIYGNQIADYGSTRFNTDNYYNLINDYSSLKNPTLPQWKDLTKSTGEKIGNTANATLTGATAGLQVGGPWGAVIGGAIGLLGGIGGWIAGDANAERESGRLNSLFEGERITTANKFNYSAGIINDKMFNAAALNYRAYGGDLYDNAMIAKHFNEGKVKRRKISYIGNMFAYGGQMRLGGDWTNGVTVIGEGGSHETNPYDGVQVGIDEKGVPNLVEEGEVIFNDYVYSNRLKPTEKQLDEVKLCPTLEGKTFAEIAELISKESEERPNDPISKNGLIDGMMKLQAIQEETREKKAKQQFMREFKKLPKEQQEAIVAEQASQAMQQNEIPQPDFNFNARYAPNGNPAEQLGEEYGFAEGGKKRTVKETWRKVKDKASLARNYVGDEIKYYWQNHKEFLSDLGDSAVNSLLSTFSKKYEKRLKEQQDSLYNDFNAYVALRRGLTNPVNEGIEEEVQESLANGGNLFNKGSWLPILSKDFEYYNLGQYDPEYIEWLNNYDIENSKYWNFLSKLYKDTFNEDLTVKRARELGQDKNFGHFHKAMGEAYSDYIQNMNPSDISDLYNISEDNISFDNNLTKPNLAQKKIVPETTEKGKTEWLRYAPAVGSLITRIGDIFGANKPDYTTANMIGAAARNIRTMRAPQLYNYLRFNPYDVNYQQNRLQNVGLGTQRNILNTTSGNRSAALASLLLGNASTLNGMGDMYKAALEYNDNQRKIVSDFNRGTDQINLQSILSAEQANQNMDVQRANLILQQAKLMDEIDTASSAAISANRSNLYKNLGNIDNDNYYKNQADWLIRSGWVPDNEQTRRYPRKNGGKIRKSKRMI